MKNNFIKNALLAASVLFTFAAFGAQPLVVSLNGVTSTTSTSAAIGASGGPVVTGQSTAVDASVWSAAGGTFTVLLEEKAADTVTVSGAPWVLVATMANCDAAGSGTVTPAGGTAATGPCGFATLSPKMLTRLRVSARTSGTIFGVIHRNER